MTFADREWARRHDEFLSLTFGQAEIVRRTLKNCGKDLREGREPTGEDVAKAWESALHMRFPPPRERRRKKK
ncbi:hypothetical protein [Pyramidobacter piscolens]|uniref:hypothetical protein n=1 Tax=Pyramidobacter piscolens TaxID=638849 RepID=UPI002AAFA862|nr:hypothetical protein [Pyramidobacter piscolens]